MCCATGLMKTPGRRKSWAGLVSRHYRRACPSFLVPWSVLSRYRFVHGCLHPRLAFRKIRSCGRDTRRCWQ